MRQSIPEPHRAACRRHRDAPVKLACPAHLLRLRVLSRMILIETNRIESGMAA
jgi:hypothetical protein